MDKNNSFIDLYESRLMLEDIMKMIEAVNFTAYEGKFPWLTKKEFNKVVEFDPTANKMYSKWLLDRFIKIMSDKGSEASPEERARRFFEDLDARDIKKNLELFYKVTKTKGGLITQAKKEISALEWGVNQGTVPRAQAAPQIEKLRKKVEILENFTVTDIMTLPTIDVLVDLMEQFKEKGNEDFLATKKEQLKDIIMIYEGPDMITGKDGIQHPHWQIVIPKNHVASRKWGTGTTWCTATENSYHYDHYTSNGPLVIIIDWTKASEEGFRRKTNGVGKWQIHLASNQFKDANDQEVSSRADVLGLLPLEAKKALSDKAGINIYTYELQDIFKWNAKENQIDSQRVLQLINQGANPHINDEAVLKWAVKVNNTELVDRFIQDPDTSRKVLADMVAEAAAASNFEFVEKIVGIVGSEAITANGSKALVKACQYPIDPADAAVYESARQAILTNSKAPPEQKKPVREAIEEVLGSEKIQQYDNLFVKVEEFYNKAVPIIKFFVENGADVNAQDGEVLGSLCQWCNDSVLYLIEYLLQHGTKVNANNSLAYWRAYYNFRPKVLKVLIAHGGKVS